MNGSPEAIEGSYLFLVKDDMDRTCKLVILIEEVEIELEEIRATASSGGTPKETVIVCSAFREVDNEVTKN
jgi:hypothetical protein